MSKSRGSKSKLWPKDCPWPEPVSPEALGSIWDPEDAEGMALDEEGVELLEIREYMDELAECGRLNPDYSLNEEYEPDPDEAEELEDAEDPWSFVPEKGEEFWDNGFDVQVWEETLLEHINCLKLEDPGPVMEIQSIIGYEFINENLLRQAFTRRAFALEYGLTGDSEELEFLGDAVLNTVLTREIARCFLETDLLSTDAPFRPRNREVDEGTLSRTRTAYCNREYLAARAAKLGLDRFILYGTGEQQSEGSLEDALEALLGAVAVDCGWDWNMLGDVADRLLCIQINKPDPFLKKSYFELFNAWHQKHFHAIPEYTLYGGRSLQNGIRQYSCTIRFSVPENDRGIRTAQRRDVKAEGRSEARELAARTAYNFVITEGLWKNLKDAGIEPRLEDAINQLQELKQKKYIEEPEYSFEECGRDVWRCSCICDGVEGFGRAIGKTKAKKKAAFMVLVELMMAAGISRKEWEEAMWKTLDPEEHTICCN